MLLGSWAIFALSISVAQADDDNENKTYRDTIVLAPDENTKVLFIGNNLKEMVKYTRLDSLKLLLIEDIKKAEKQANYPMAPKTTHYFVTATGKRRLKTEGEDFLEPEVNVEKERQSLELNLPPYTYIIHDLAANYECYIYVKDSGQIKALSNESFNDALSSIASDKKLLRHTFRVDLEKKNDLWKLQDHYRSTEDLIELTPSFGLGLIGNQWSPTLGGDVQLMLSNRYGKPAFKSAFGLSGYTFMQSNNNEISGLNFVTAYCFKFSGNLSSLSPGSSKAKWAGLEGGWMKASRGGSLDGAYKIGFLSEGFSVFNFSFDIIRTKNKNSIYGVTLMFPF